MEGIADDMGRSAFEMMGGAAAGVAGLYAAGAMGMTIAGISLSGAAAVGALAVLAGKVHDQVIHMIHQRYPAVTYHADLPKEKWVQRESTLASIASSTLTFVTAGLLSPLVSSDFVKAAITTAKVGFGEAFVLASAARYLGEPLGAHVWYLASGIKTGIHYEKPVTAPIADPVHPRIESPAHQKV